MMLFTFAHSLLNVITLPYYFTKVAIGYVIHTVRFAKYLKELGHAT